MATNNKTKEVKKAADNTVNKETVKKAVEKKEVNKTEKKETEKKATEKKERKSVKTVKQFTNTEMKKLFSDNGCATYTNAKDSSGVVYNTFGTKSRILQQGGAYQLLLTNGHKKVKNEVVDTDNDDVLRFKKFYDKLNKEEKGMVLGYDTIDTAKLADSEFPRERTVKIINTDLLVKYIQYMATFEENKVVVAK